MYRHQKTNELRSLERVSVFVTGGRIGFVKGTLNFHEDTRRRVEPHYPKRTQCLKQGYYVTTEGGREVKIDKGKINYIDLNWIHM